MSRIYVGNLDYSTSDADLRLLFEKFGRVSSVHLPIDRSTGRSRGFAFVTMSRLDDADEAAVRLNGSDLRGRSIVVTEASTDRRIEASPSRTNAVTRLNLL